MQRRDPRIPQFSRRASLLIAGKVSLLGAVLGRTYYLQVLQAEKYKLLAEDNRINLRLLTPERGVILDRFGKELAGNRPNFRVDLIAEEAPDVSDTLDRLSAIIPLSKLQKDKVLSEVKRKRKFQRVQVVDNLTWAEFSKINVALDQLPGLHPDAGTSRVYPMARPLAHVVGYVGAVSARELSGDPVLEQPGFRIGKNGVELAREKNLRGQAGNAHIEVNAFGRVIRELDRRDPVPGDKIALTLDADLQASVTALLGEESASVAAIDIHSGEVLSLVSNPAYDPNAFSQGISTTTWRKLVNNPRSPLANKAVGGQYPPGSTFKMLVALAALEEGVGKADEHIYCNGLYKLGNGRFHCWRAKYGGHGKIDLVQALEQSCDVYFYELAHRLGPQKIAAVAKRLGLGATTGLGLPGERPGLIPTPAWKRAVHGKRWNGGETLIVGIGQGSVLTTPLQLALMTARLTNGGRAVEARLFRDLEGNGNANTTVARADSLGFNQKNLNIVLDGMNRVVNSKKGTGRAHKIDKTLGRMGGKTGTVQVKRITRAERAAGITKNVDRRWKDRDHSLFVAYGPIDAPKYAVSVVIEHGGSGTVAAGLAKKIMEELLKRDPVERPAIGRPLVKRSVAKHPGVERAGALRPKDDGQG